VQQYRDHVELKEPSFFAIKLPVLLLIINLFVFQIIFHVSVATLTSVAAQQNLFSFEGLSQFTFDLWLIVFLLSLGVFCYSKITKQKECLLVIFIIMPMLTALLSLMRDVSSIIVTVLSGVIAFLIYRYNFQKLSAKYLEEAADKINKGIH
jgi:hypothetical protein